MHDWWKQLLRNKTQPDMIIGYVFSFVGSNENTYICEYSQKTIRRCKVPLSLTVYQFCRKS